MDVFASLIYGYLLGSISPGIIIGKVFFKKDPRDYGSGNSGGTNSGRVFGKKIGMLVIVLDALKGLIALWTIYLICKYALKNLGLFMDPSYYAYIAGFAATLGHSFPIFSNFKGGKAVACSIGLLVATNWGMAIASLIFFFLILKWKKYVSLGSILASIFNAILSFIPIFAYTSTFGIKFDIFFTLFSFALATLVTIKHKENIKRIIKGTESKITWLK